MMNSTLISCCWSGELARLLGQREDIMDITIVYVAWGVGAFLGLFYLVATVRIIWLLQDIRLEVRMLNDTPVGKEEQS